MVRRFMFRIPEDEEIIGYIGNFAREKEIRAGFVSAIGSLKNAKLGYFDRDEGRYLEIDVNETMELVSAMGNLSIKENSPFPHIHAVLGNREGKLLGGHLIEGRVFVAEVYIEGYPEEMVREKYGNLYLWRT